MAVWAVVYYFSLMCSYFIIKPVRDEMGIAGGVQNLQYLYTGTFFVMLLIVPAFGWLTSRFPREKFLPYVYLFFISNIIFFYVLFSSDISDKYIARAFFIWVSVYNLFVISVFWSFLSDIFTNSQAGRLFAIIASGGTAGGIFGPLLTTFLVPLTGTYNLLAVSAIFLVIALFSMNRLYAWHRRTASTEPLAENLKSGPFTYLRGGILSGIRLVAASPYLLGICLMILLYTTLSTFLYFQQLTIIENTFDDPVKRTALFGTMEFLTNTLTLIGQLLVTRTIIRKFGAPVTLALVPFILCFGFLALWYAPVAAVIVAVQVLRRAGNYSITRPVREMLYVVLSKEEQYKAKNFIDTAVYRGGDMASAWIYTGLGTGLGLGLSAIALIAVPVSGIWAMIAYRLGGAQEKLAGKQAAEQRIDRLQEQLLPPVPEQTNS